MKRCSNASRSNPKKKPGCNGGKGCDACNEKFQANQAAQKPEFSKKRMDLDGDIGTELHQTRLADPEEKSVGQKLKTVVNIVKHVASMEKEAKPASVRKIILTGIRNGLPEDRIEAEVKAAHPDSKAAVEFPRHYRWHLGVVRRQDTAKAGSGAPGAA